MLALALGAAALGTTAIAALGHGAYHRNSPIFGRPMSRLPGGARTVALTFDDGPNFDATPAILRALREERVPATFFLLGRHVDRWPDLARQIVDDGHEVANHGYFHRKLHWRGPRYARSDLERGTAAIQLATGERPRLFRAPHGFRSPWVTTIARSLGQQTVGWSLGVWDSSRPGVDAIARRALAGVRPGHIVLMHDGDGYDPWADRMQTALALPRIIHGLRERGYTFVALP